jgi:hypothetical protein
LCLRLLDLRRTARWSAHEPSRAALDCLRRVAHGLLSPIQTPACYVFGDPKLSATAKTLIQDASNEVLISPASYWEMAIKVSLGKWVLHRPYEDFLDTCLNQ